MFDHPQTTETAPPRKGRAWILLAAMAAALLAPVVAPAQNAAPPTPRPFNPNAVQSQTVDPFASEEIIDFRERMRTFVQSIAAYGYSLDPGFVVIARDGLELVSKADPLDPDRRFPARAYARAVDGVMESALLDETVTNDAGKVDAILKDQVERRRENIDNAKRANLTIFDLEFSTQPQEIDKLYAQMTDKGYVPYVAPGTDMARLPDHPSSAVRANPDSIVSVRDVKNYIYLSHAQAFGTTQDYIRAVRDTNHDMVVIDVFSNGQPLTRQQVDLLKYKKLGARRLVLAHVDISSAASYHYYWEQGWRQGNPPFIFTPVREDPDRHRVIYWHPGWHDIIYGNPNSYVYGVADLGFDGVVLTGVDEWRYYESGGEPF